LGNRAGTGKTPHLSVYRSKEKHAMSEELVSGFSATQQANTQPDQSFVWDAEESSGTTSPRLSSRREAGPRWAMTAQQASPGIGANGSVQAAWSADNRSYAVTFSGFMVQESVNNIESSDQNGTPGTAAPIIVAAYLAS
jgi:hypothetical protein